MRSPSLTELYSDDPFVPLLRFGNTYVSGQSDLKPEKNLQFDLGVAYEDEESTCGVRGFVSLLRDHIWTAPFCVDPSAPDFIDGGHNLGRDFSYFTSRTDVGTLNENADTNQVGYVYTNVDRATIAGLDLYVDRRVRDWLAVGGNLAYVHGTNHSPVQVFEDDEHNLTFAPTVSSEPLPGIYPFRGTVWLRLIDPRCERWSVQVAARMVRGQDRVAFTLSELPTPGFTVFDVSGYYAADRPLPHQPGGGEPLGPAVHRARFAGPGQPGRAGRVCQGTWDQRVRRRGTHLLSPAELLIRYALP